MVNVLIAYKPIKFCCFLGGKFSLFTVIHSFLYTFILKNINKDLDSSLFTHFFYFYISVTLLHLSLRISSYSLKDVCFTYKFTRLSGGRGQSGRPGTVTGSWSRSQR